ncbi:Uncharacterised protein [uncultured archaeon]|nr:Uncharacterised protein [uncultured archaeon]
MSLVFPCEIIGWQVLPAVRREIAKYLISEKKMTRKEVARKLGITEAAICQYLKAKRGGSHKFNDHDLEKVREMADLLMKSDKGLGKMCVVCRDFDAADEALAKAGIENPARA